MTQKTATFRKNTQHMSGNLGIEKLRAKGFKLKLVITGSIEFVGK